MKKLHINLKNCFGIQKLDCSFDFEKSNSILIYASNGMMKTSLAKTFDCITKHEEPKDQIYDRETRCQIKADNKNIQAESIYVLDTDKDIDNNARITTLLARKDLNNEYKKIHQELDDAKQDFLKRLKKMSSCSDCENEVIETFKKYEKDNFFSCLQHIFKNSIRYKQKYTFKYDDIFNDKVKNFVEEHKTNLEEYFINYNSLLRQSILFKRNNSGKSFGTYQAELISKSVSDNAFFDAKHKIKLSNGKEINNQKELETLIDEEKRKIFEDEELKKSFEKIDKAIGKNAELRSFRTLLEQDKSIIIELSNYNGFKKKVWLGYLNDLASEAKELILLYKDTKNKLSQLLKASKKDATKWQEIVDTYNKRFFMPFSIEIQNQEDVIVKKETPTLVFKYKDSDKNYIEKSKEDILKVLSKGEKRAFYLLQFLFEVEARRAENQETIFILDDIADSFDYKNKYAIIEYLKDIHCDKDGLFKQIILTHNFDFYRNVASRLNLKNIKKKKVHFMVIKKDNGEISLETGKYTDDFLKKEILDDVKNDPKKFITMIPFVRNIIKYTKGRKSKNFITKIPFVRNIIKYTKSKSNEYEKLTSCLHIKKDSAILTNKDISEIFKNHIDSFDSKFNDNKNTIDFIKETALKISQEQNINEILLENKIVLSIAIRLLAEEFMIKRLGNKLDLENITSNQTKELIDKYKDIFKSDENLKLLEEVNIITPENIHVNSFMYEPLIDTSVQHLMRLYNDILELCANNGIS